MSYVGAGAGPVFRLSFGLGQADWTRTTLGWKRLAVKVWTPQCRGRESNPRDARNATQARRPAVTPLRHRSSLRYDVTDS